MMTESVPAQEAIEALTGFLNTKSLLDLACRFSNTYSGLAKTSTEHFLTTPVTALPTGEEQGKFLCIDVGGSNLRAGFVELLGDNDNATPSTGDDVFAKIKRSCDKSWPIGDHLKMDQAEDLFLWIGDCIAEVITDSLNDTSTKNSESSSEDILLGITFSFPMS
jgi:hexokinase